MSRNDEYRSRMLAIVEELHAQGVGRYTTAPPLYRLAWRLGVRVPPPVYQSFARLAVQMGVGFGLTWGFVMWFFFWRTDYRSPVFIVIAALLAGMGFGMGVAGVYRRQAKSVRLPSLE